MPLAPPSFAVVGFMPHGHCYLWSEPLIWLHATSDALIALAYFSIPLALVYFVRQRPDVPHRGMFLLFGAFILACGTTHLLEVSGIWNAHYYLNGWVKAFTAAVSLLTAAALFRILPAALRIPSARELRELNLSLEARVAGRTEELERTNTTLRNEIAERERAEAEVQRLNQQLARRVAELEALFRALPVGVGIADDPECRRIRTNDTFARMLGIEVGANASLTADQEVAPRTFRVLHRDREVPPEDLIMQVCVRENRAILGLEETIERSDGEVFEVLANAVPLHDPEGRATGCVATFQDITALAEAQQHAARFAAIVTSTSEAVIGKDLNGIVTDWNHGAESIFGFTAAEMIGQPIHRIIPPEHRSQEALILARIVAGETITLHDAIRQRRDGVLIHVSLSVSPIRDRSGRIVGASKLARDITEHIRDELQRQEMDRKLQETQKLESLGVLAGGIAHDFNNLLTGVLGNASLARLELPPSSPVIPLIDSITETGRRAADLCHQMLAYSGRGRFVVAHFDLNQIVTETTQLLSVSIGKSCILRFNLSPLPLVISADATQLRQIIMNLVINASEAIGARSGVIALSTGFARIDEDYRQTLLHQTEVELGDYAFLEVSDNGTGMDAKTVARIFDPFFTTKFTGRGLGLAAVLGIVRGHRGALKVYSEPNRGTTFKLFLPCDTAAKPTLAPTPAGDRPAPPATGRVLVVDDEETVRSVTARALERMGYTVETAEDGRIAVEKFRAEPGRYRLVLLDLTMPHLDGEETFRQLRHLNPGIRVVLMSGFNEQEAVGRFAGKGLAGFVQKPFEAAVLAAAVREVMLAS